MDNILILGGTGAMGSFLTHILAEKYNVEVTSRKKRDNILNVSYIIGNAHNLEFLNSLLNKKYYAIFDFMNYSTSEFEERYESILAHTSQYFYFSSARVYSNSKYPIKESDKRLLDDVNDSTFLRTDDYALAKARQEDILRASRTNNWTIIRPYMTYFSNRLDLGIYPKEVWLYRAIHNKKVVFTDDVASRRTTLTFGNDVACALVNLLGQESAKGETFHITCKKSFTWKEIIDIYTILLKKQGIKLDVVYLPTTLCENNYIHKYDRSFDRVFDITKINEFIDTSSFLEPSIGLQNCLEQFLNNIKFSPIDWKMQAYCDRITKEKTKLSEIASKKDKLLYILFRYVISYSFLRNIYHKIKRL